MAYDGFSNSVSKFCGLIVDLKNINIKKYSLKIYLKN